MLSSDKPPERQMQGKRFSYTSLLFSIYSQLVFFGGGWGEIY
jgi:hypothetical protein